MGTTGTSIVKIDVDKLLGLLNEALADEWLAYYQYWIGAKVIKGPMKGEVMGELMQHADDELRHAGLLVERIIQLGGTPILDPKEWQEKTHCGYLTPDDPFVKKILEQNISGEQCAIEVYEKLTELTRGKDEVTYRIVTEILSDEVEHEEDLQALMEDLETIK